jgi:hypothetical protein
MKYRFTADTCQLGVTQAELREILGDRYDPFLGWMHGQTMAICEGRQFNYETRQYEPSGCGPHGLVAYRWDLEKFLQGGEAV